MSSRRVFLKRTAAVCSIGSSVPQVWRQAASAAGPDRDATILVVVELTGGNDGLNTVVPHANDVYQKSRPTLRVKPDKVLKLDDLVGLNDALKDMQPFWDGGDLAVIQQVGYPNPNRSHFESMAVWQSGAAGQAAAPAGWLGRAADAHPGLSPCHVGPAAPPLAVRGRTAAPQSLASLAEFQLAPGADLGPAAESKNTNSGPVVEAIRAQYREASDLLRRLEQVPRDGGTLPVAGTLEGRLETVRRMIAAQAPARVYYTSLDGFDTHAAQVYAHPRLLRTLAESLAAFFKNLKESRDDARTAVLVFSEFGRRLKENASGGTDHGAPGPVLLVGPGVKGGLYGSHPDLSKLDEVGDPRFAVDYRDVYAAVLRRWLDVDPSPIVGPREAAFNLFG
ncbi:MAG: DUF1501 domain-containing protein [Paludisphaera borealis]|uniref:DUF1501 domain-containing protein n=1 Tax=Paludisphaera borealis TaxID=1387353 RepID=UPI0028480CCB|nr:DUF1501 domain-containing protein [Paludisphaera borealis]MDR3620024.1 DUF1501 domain-containing protein [Paludisphaera borealis]